jgi:hypothetical protein
MFIVQKAADTKCTLVVLLITFRLELIVQLNIQLELYMETFLLRTRGKFLILIKNYNLFYNRLGVSKFFQLEGQTANNLGFVPRCLGCNSSFAKHKQPQAVCTQMGVAVFPKNATDKNRQQTRSVPQAVV